MFVQVPNMYRDNRDIKNKRKTKTTISGYHKPKALQEFKKNIIQGVLDKSCYWMAELDLSAQSTQVWNHLLLMVSREINIANPKLPILAWDAYQNFLPYQNKKDVQCCNLQTLRNHLSRLMGACCLSNKSKMVPLPTFKKDKPLLLQDYQVRIKQKHFRGIEDVVKISDSKVIYVPLNEIDYALEMRSDPMNTRNQIWFWISWVYETERRRKNSEVHLCSARDVPGIPGNCKQDIAWPLWQIIFRHAKKKTPLQQEVIKSLYRLFKTDYTKGKRRSRLPFMLHAFLILIDSIPALDYTHPMMPMGNLLITTSLSINSIYRQTLLSSKEAVLNTTKEEKDFGDAPKEMEPRMKIYVPIMEKPTTTI